MHTATPIGQRPTRHEIDPISRLYYRYAFRVEFMKSRGTAFQTLFSKLMLAVHAEDFSPSGTYGNEGDRKCDGYLHSERRVFAVFAPKDFIEAKYGKKKIRDDHSGAVKNWLQDMDHWTLVHNADPCLPGSYIQLLKQLERSQPKVQVREWDCDRIQSLLDWMKREQLEDAFPGAPNRNDLLGISHADIKQAVEELSVRLDMEAHPADTSEQIVAVPSEKAAYNRLSRSAQDWLNIGRRSGARVHNYFETHTDPHLAQRVADAFRQKYLELRARTQRSDDIFDELTDYAGFPLRSKRISMASLAVVAYLFERCHIFERPLELPPGNVDAPSD